MKQLIQQGGPLVPEEGNTPDSSYGLVEQGRHDVSRRPTL